jgi:hypothetical protein
MKPQNSSDSTSAINIRQCVQRGGVIASRISIVTWPRVSCVCAAAMKVEMISRMTLNSISQSVAQANTYRTTTSNTKTAAATQIRTADE